MNNYNRLYVVVMNFYGLIQRSLCLEVMIDIKRLIFLLLSFFFQLINQVDK